MCGRIVITHPSDEMARIFAAAPANDLPGVPNYNVCPTNRVHVVHAGGGAGDAAEDGPEASAAASGSASAGRRLVAMRWGFLPHWYEAPNDGPLLINARAETVAEKPAFRAAVRARRCLIPATGFYEWTKDDAGRRLPWYIRPRDGRLMVFAGIWQDWSPPIGSGPDGSGPGGSLAGAEGGAEVQAPERMRTCAVITTTAADAVGRLHHRMPVEIAPADWALWLGEAGGKAAPLLGRAVADDWRFDRVDSAVNSNRAAGPALIAPIDA